MNYLLDTCIISELAKPKPEKKVVTWIEGYDEDFFFLSVLTLGEIQKGIAKLSDQKRKASYQHWLDADLRTRFSGRILPVDQDVALAWGILQGKAEAAGRPLPTVDGLLGATAVVHNLTVVTRNEPDLVATGAPLFNPWKM
ncbi:MAG: type II toxin-antitoxin system VapC family toxin [Chitinivibrionales bacterium]|nr:type II toxin-antitoxin system VapC family toxin [Chitinivibrionales bacterium]